MRTLRTIYGSSKRGLSRIFLRLVFVFFTSNVSLSFSANATEERKQIDMSLFSDGIHHWDLFSTIRDYQHLEPDDIQGIATQFLRFQNPDGGWPKNVDWLGVLDPEVVKAAMPDEHWESSFDNRNTYPQIRYLAEAFEREHIEAYRDAAIRGLTFILESQNASGGWRGADVDAITFNDDVMVGIMSLLYDIQGNCYSFAWVSGELKDELSRAFDRALKVTLDCQVCVDGVKTAWCQQHDHLTLMPVKARSYELPSITPMESSGIVEFLMSLENPSNEVINAIVSAVHWFQNVAIAGHRLVEVSIPEQQFHEKTVNYDRVFIEDPEAPLIWARYYDLVHSEPFLCKRSGQIVYDFSEISFERRIGYSWYGYWPQRALKAFPIWKKSIVLMTMYKL